MDPVRDQRPKNPKAFIVLFVATLLVVAAAIWVWQAYLSPEARSARQMKENYESYQRWEENYKDILRKDTYGGNTPEETLAFFINALEKEDVELASKYFYLNTDEKSKYFLTHDEWKEGLVKIKNENRIPELISTIKKMEKKEGGEKDISEYVLKGKDGIADYTLILKLNTYSSVWKIESL